MPKKKDDKGVHPTMARIYEAAIEAKLVTRSRAQSDMADLLMTLPQNVNNWEARGPSQPILLAIQAKTNINATWATTGQGPRFIGATAPPPFSPELIKEMTKRGKDWHWVENMARSALEMEPLARPQAQQTVNW